MRRAGFTGDIWPDEIQELLLRAALLPDDAGGAAWAAVRPRIDIDHLPGELHRLIPQLSKNLTTRGVDDPDLSRLKGVYQFTWYRNQLLFADGAALVGALEAARVLTMLVRGAAMAVGYYGDLGVRPMNDLDVLVRPAEIDHARGTAEAAGWLPVTGSEPFERREKAVALRNDEGRIVRLHWEPSRNVSPGLESEPVWQRAREIRFHHTATRVPSAADHLVLACIDGARANSGSSLRWVTDVITLLRAAPDVDWDVVVSEARRHHVTPLVEEALRYLVEAFDADVPRDALRRLAASPTGPRERVAHRLSLTTSPRIASAAEVLGRFTRQTADLSLPRAVSAAPAFLEAMLGVDRHRDLPLAATRKAVRAIVSPSPPLASLSTAGPTTTGQNLPRSRHERTSP
jgi:Uncharacterised nucleotidyltransferase